MTLGVRLSGAFALIALTIAAGLNPAAAQVSDVSRRIQQASGFMVFGAQADALGKLSVPPALSAQDAGGTCENTELRFSDQAARDEWLLPGYNSMLNLWAILHDGARAGTSRSRGTRCADLEFSARRWQQALGEPATGALTQGQARRFTSLVDAHEPSFAQARAKRTGQAVASILPNRAGEARPQSEALSTPPASRESSQASSRRPRDLRPGTYGLEWHVNECFQRQLSVQGGSKRAILDCLLGPVPEPLEQAAAPPATIRIDLATLVLGVERDAAMSRVAGPLCRATNPDSIACAARPTLKQMCGGEDRALVEFRQKVFQKIDWAIRYREPLTQFHNDVVAYPRLEDNLAACKERHRAAPETSAELVFDGVALRSAQLAFSQRKLVEISFIATDVDVVSRWMTSRFGAPTVNLSTVGGVSVRQVPADQWTDQVFVENNQRTVRHQTWSAPGIAVQSEGADFRMTAVGQR